MQYVLLVVTDQDKGQSKLIVRGDGRSGYHMDIFEKAARELTTLGLHVGSLHTFGLLRWHSSVIWVHMIEESMQEQPHVKRLAVHKAGVC